VDRLVVGFLRDAGSTGLHLRLDSRILPTKHLSTPKDRCVAVRESIASRPDEVRVELGIIAKLGSL